MPYTRDFNLVVGGTFGGVHSPCWVDDVGTAALNTPQVWHRVDVPGTGDRFFPADAKEIRLRRDRPELGGHLVEDRPDLIIDERVGEAEIVVQDLEQELQMPGQLVGGGAVVVSGLQ